MNAIDSLSYVTIAIKYAIMAAYIFDLYAITLAHNSGQIYCCIFNSFN